MTIDISIIIGTYDRCETLWKVLESVAKMELSAKILWELIVVDNNSSDNTEKIVDEARKKWCLPIRYVFEERQGLSFARNTGIEAAKGQILAFTDDDCLVDKEWLSSIVAEFDRNLDAIGLGGKIIALWESEKPGWLNMDEMPGPIVAFDPSHESRERGIVPIGANMAFRRIAFERYGKFRTDMGPKGQAPGGAEDTEFGRRVLRGGEKLVYAPVAIVFHPVNPKRISKKYFQHWYFYYGKSLMREHGYSANTVTYGGIPRYLFRIIAVNFLKWMCTLNPNARFAYKIDTFRVAGEFAACLTRQTQINTNASCGN